MIASYSAFPVSNRLSTARRQLNALIQQAAARDEVIRISLPRVGAEYAYVGNRLVVDGQPQPVRAS